MHVYSLATGEELVKATRNTIELYLSTPRFEKEMVKKSLVKFREKHGLHIRLRHYPTMELRGSMGFTRAIATIGESIVDAAISAAFEDPKHVPVSMHELSELLIEVNVLSSPLPVKGDARKRLKEIEIGRDGLLVEYGAKMGFLLPHEAVEQNWSKKRFLEEACKRAGLHSNYWSQPSIRIYKFETQVFREETPSGYVMEL